MQEHILDKKLYLLAELDDVSQSEIKEIEKIIIENGFIGEQTKDIPYHITLCSFPTEMENYLKDLLENLNGIIKNVSLYEFFPARFIKRAELL